MFEQSPNKKADLIIRIIGLQCFQNNWKMKRLKGKEIPTTLQKFDHVFKMTTDNKWYDFLAFDNKNEILCGIKDGVEDNTGYLEVLKQLGCPEEKIKDL